MKRSTIIVGAMAVGAVVYVTTSADAGNRRRARRASSPAASSEIVYPGTGVASADQPALFSWSTANTCDADWDPLPAYQGGTAADMDQSETNNTVTCDVTTSPSGDNAPFGDRDGLQALGIGTARIDDAWSSAAASCWLDATPDASFAAVTEGTNIHYRFVFMPTTTSGTKVISYENTSAAEYRQLEMGTAITWRLREGSSGNQTITHTPTLNIWHVYDFFFVSDCNGDAGFPCVYCYYDGGPCEGTGGTMTQGTELGVNMAAFGAITAISLFCSTTETNMWNGTFLLLEEDQGSQITDRYGADATAWEASHRSDCRDMGICSSDTTVMVVLGGQSLAPGFNSTATSGVTVTSNSARATVAANHGISVGDLINTTAHTTNATGVLVTAVGATTVDYPLTAGDGALADGVGVVTVVASTQTQLYNDREGRNNGTLPLLVEGTAGVSGAYESPLSSITVGLHALRTGEQYVGFERGVTNTSIVALNEDLGDGTDTLPNYDNLEVWANDLDDRVASLGTTPIEAMVGWLNQEGGTGGNDYVRQNWSEYLVALQADLDEDLKAITGQSIEVAMCFSQHNNWTSAALTTGTIANEGLDAHEILLNGNRGALTGPLYQYYFSDGTHPTPDTYKRLGQNQYARCFAANRAVLKSEDGAAWWSPTRPTAITCSGTTVTVTIHAPTPPLALDTTTVTDPGDSGFEYFDTDASANPTIDAVSCAAACTGQSCSCALTFSASPCALLGASIAYAWTGTSNNSAGPATGARGNVRDSADTDADANWLVAFRRPIAQTFVDEYAWDGDGALEECASADNALWEPNGASGQVLTGLVVDGWIKLDTTANQLTVIAKGSFSGGVTWSVLTQSAAAPVGGAYWIRAGIGGPLYFQFGNIPCADEDDCDLTTLSGNNGFRFGRWVHFVITYDLTRGTFATTAATCEASGVDITATVASVPAYVTVGQQAVTAGLTTNTAASGGTISAITATTITYGVTTCTPGALADGVGTLTINDAKIRAYAAEADASGSSPTFTTRLTEMSGTINSSMPIVFTENAQPLRLFGLNNGGSGVNVLNGEIGEIAFWYARAIDEDGSTRSYSLNEVRECLESGANFEPVDHNAMMWHTYSDGGVYKNCAWPELRAWYRMGDGDSGTTLLNHSWYNQGAPAMTCTNNTGNDIVADSID